MSKRKTKRAIENAINDGFNTFITGMAIGFDMICAEILIEYKKHYPNIKIIGALPCRDQDKLWNVGTKQILLLQTLLEATLLGAKQESKLQI